MLLCLAILAAQAQPRAQTLDDLRAEAVRDQNRDWNAPGLDIWARLIIVELDRLGAHAMQVSPSLERSRELIEVTLESCDEACFAFGFQLGDRLQVRWPRPVERRLRRTGELRVRDLVDTIEQRWRILVLRGVKAIDTAYELQGRIPGRRGRRAWPRDHSVRGKGRRRPPVANR